MPPACLLPRTLAGGFQRLLLSLCASWLWAVDTVNDLWQKGGGVRGTDTGT